MASSKKKRKQGTKRGGSAFIAEVDRVIHAALREAREKGGYERRLGLTDESALRECEQSLGQFERMAMAVLVNGNFKPLYLRSSKTRSTFTRRMMSVSRAAVENLFSSSVCLILSESLEKRAIAGETDSEPTEVQENVMDLLPEKYINFDEAEYRWSIGRATHTKIEASILEAVVEWDELFRGNDVVKWAKRAYELLEAVLTEEEIAQFESQRQSIFVTVTLETMRLIPAKMREHAEHMRSEGLEIDYPSSHAFVAPRADLTLKLRNELRLPDLAQLKIPEIKPPTVVDTPQEDKRSVNNALVYFSTAEFCDYLSCMELLNGISHELKYNDIAYSMIWALAQCHSEEEITLFTQIMFIFAFTRSFSRQPFDRDNLQSVRAKGQLELNPYLLKTIPDREFASLKSWNREVGGTEEDFRNVYQYINLAQLVFAETDVILPSTLQIDTSLRKFIGKLGYTPSEAYALCGYISACSSLYDIAQFAAGLGSFDDLMDYEKRKLARNPVNLDALLNDARAEERKKAKKEAESELQDSIAAARRMKEEVEADRRRLMREHRMNAFHTAQATELAESQTEEIQRLRKEIKQMVGEQRRLEQTILTLSEQIPDSQEDGDRDTDMAFPSDIGKSIKFNVYGGAINWIAEQRTRFPYVNFFDAETMPNEANVANSDILMLNTFVMNHKYFWIIQHVAKQFGVPMIYFRNKGINSGSRQIMEVYQDFVSEKTEEE